MLATMAVVEVLGNDPSTSGTQFVTLVPLSWSEGRRNYTNITFQIINPSVNETAKLIVEYENSFGRLKANMGTHLDIPKIEPNSYLTITFPNKVKLIQVCLQLPLSLKIEMIRYQIVSLKFSYEDYFPFSMNISRQQQQ